MRIRKTPAEDSTGAQARWGFGERRTPGSMITNHGSSFYPPIASRNAASAASEAALFCSAAARPGAIRPVRQRIADILSTRPLTDAECAVRLERNPQIDVQALVRGFREILRDLSEEAAGALPQAQRTKAAGRKKPQWLDGSPYWSLFLGLCGRNCLRLLSPTGRILRCQANYPPSPQRGKSGKIRLSLPA